MSLKGIKILLRVIGALVFFFGLYLIFVEKQFFGIFVLIAALLILPSVEKNEKPKTAKGLQSEKNSDSMKKENPSRTVDSDGEGG